MLQNFGIETSFKHIDMGRLVNNVLEEKRWVIEGISWGSCVWLDSISTAMKIWDL